MALVVPPGFYCVPLAFQQEGRLVALGGGHDRRAVQPRAAPAHEGVERRSVHLFLVHRHGELAVGLTCHLLARLEPLAQFLDRLLVGRVNPGLRPERSLLLLCCGRFLDRTQTVERVPDGGAVEFLDLRRLSQFG